MLEKINKSNRIESNPIKSNQFLTNTMGRRPLGRDNGFKGVCEFLCSGGQCATVSVENDLKMVLGLERGQSCI